jgi:hypothetical protein
MVLQKEKIGLRHFLERENKVRWKKHSLSYFELNFVFYFILYFFYKVIFIMAKIVVFFLTKTKFVNF